MSRVCYGFSLVLTGTLFLVGACFSESTASAQDKDKGNSEVARIVTVDGIKLNAQFYPKGSKSSATVIMLHPIGQGNNIRLPGWKKLADELHKAGYSVLIFDFRGHGDSTTIEEEKAYLSYAPNRTFKLKEKETIDYKDYKAVANTYLPVLVNDIAAVKSFLDRKNDAGVCNTSNTIVIGADQGATLGAVWINSEWSRYKYTPPLNAFQKPEYAKSPEGKDIVASVFLTAQPKLGARAVTLSSTLRIACKEQAMATVLFYGKDDTTARTLAKGLEAALKPAKAGKKYEFIGAAPLDTKLSGVQLLQDGLDSKESIVAWLDKVVMDRGNEWVERDSQGALFMWRFPNPPVYAKKQKGEKNLEFNDYLKYVQ
jgi:predicted esterase